jgi:hypothetical protein
MGAYQDLQPHVIAQRVAARRRRMQRPGLVTAAAHRNPHAGTHGLSGCHCGGTCGGCGDENGMGDFTGEGSGVLWGSLAAAGFLIWAAFGNKKRR